MFEQATPLTKRINELAKKAKNRWSDRSGKGRADLIASGIPD